MMRNRDQSHNYTLTSLRQILLAVLLICSFIIVLFAALLNAFGFISISWGTFLPLTITLLSIVFILLDLLYPMFFNSQGVPSLKLVSLLRPLIPNFLLSTSDEVNYYKRIEGLPLPTDPKVIQQREDIVIKVLAMLALETTSGVVLTGIDGIGKSTLAALIYRYAEEQFQAGKGVFTAGPIWLTISDDVTMRDLVGTILERLNKPIPNLNSLTQKNLVKLLAGALNSEDKACLIVVDQFENFLNLQTGHALARHVGLSEWLDEINSRSYRCRMLFTSRIRPQGDRLYSPTHLQEYLVKGLSANEGAQLLRRLKVQASDKELLTVVEKCNGHALSLIQLASLLRKDGSLTLEILLQDSNYDRLWLGDVTENSFAYIYTQQLNEVEHRILLILSVFREAIPLHILTTISDDFGLTEIQKQLPNILHTLISHDLLQLTQGDLYHLKAFVIAYLERHLDESHKHFLRMAHARAAQYYLQRAAIDCPPREKRRYIRDVHPLIEATWHLCQAEQWQEAYYLMEQENIFTDLRRWGGISILLELYQQLLPVEKLMLRKPQEAHVYNNLGKIYDNLGKKPEAKKYYKQALSICREVNDLEEETLALNNLSGVYSVLGKKKKARKYLEQALSIARELGNREGEGTTLNNLGRVYSILGKKELASQYLEHALSIFKEAGDHRGEGRTLNNLALVYDDLGQSHEAQRAIEQALTLMREMGDRWGEGRALNNIGRIYENQGKVKLALTYFEGALSIRREVQDRGGEATTLNNLGRVYDMLNQREKAQGYLEQALSDFQRMGDLWGEGRACNNLGRIYFLKGEKEPARRYYEWALRVFREVHDRSGKARVFNNIALLIADQQKEEALKLLKNALRICREVGDRRGEGWTLHNLGRIYVMLGQKEDAQKAFGQAWRTRREVGDRKGEGWTLHNIGTLFLKEKHYDKALACFILADGSFDEIRSPDHEKIQKEINGLREEIGDEEFTALLAKVEPLANLLVEQSLRDVYE